MPDILDPSIPLYQRLMLATTDPRKPANLSEARRLLEEVMGVLSRRMSEIENTKQIQRILGVPDDGIVGPHTLAALREIAG